MIQRSFFFDRGIFGPPGASKMYTTKAAQQAATTFNLIILRLRTEETDGVEPTVCRTFWCQISTTAGEGLQGKKETEECPVILQLVKLNSEEQRYRDGPTLPIHFHEDPQESNVGTWRIAAVLCRRVCFAGGRIGKPLRTHLLAHIRHVSAVPSSRRLTNNNAVASRRSHEFCQPHCQAILTGASPDVLARGEGHTQPFYPSDLKK